MTLNADETRKARLRRDAERIQRTLKHRQERLENPQRTIKISKNAWSEQIKARKADKEKQDRLQKAMDARKQQLEEEDAVERKELEDMAERENAEHELPEPRREMPEVFKPKDTDEPKAEDAPTVSEQPVESEQPQVSKTEDVPSYANPMIPLETAMRMAQMSGRLLALEGLARSLSFAIDEMPRRDTQVQESADAVSKKSFSISISGTTATVAAGAIRFQGSNEAIAEADVTLSGTDPYIYVYEYVDHSTRGIAFSASEPVSDATRWVWVLAKATGSNPYSIEEGDVFHDGDIHVQWMLK